MYKAKAQPTNQTQKSHLFSSMKNKLNSMLGRSPSIAPESLSELHKKSDIGDGQTDSLSSVSDTEHEPVVQHGHHESLEHDSEDDA